MEHEADTLSSNSYDRIGFNLKKRNKKLIRLVPLGTGNNMETIIRIEQDLLRDINDIDLMLQKRQSNMSYIRGFLFSVGHSKQLLKQFHSALRVTPDAVQQGFYLWRLREYNDNYALVSSKLVNSPRHFPQKLLAKSIQNLMNYDKTKHVQSVGKGKERWDQSVRARNFQTDEKGRRLKTEAQSKTRDGMNNRKFSQATGLNVPKNEVKRKLSDFKQLTNINNQHSQPIELQSSFRPKKIRIPRLDEPAKDEAPSIEELSTILKKQAEVVSVWLPPSACPQFMGVMSIEIKEKSYNVKYCLIKKYYWYRHGVSRRLFDSILRWSSHQYEGVAELSLITTKELFNSIFSGKGWHLASWINEDKIRITYSSS